MRTLVNGVLADSVAADDRGLLYGDGLFETFALRAGQLRFRAAHLARLQAGLQRLQLSVPSTSIVTALAAAHAGCEHGTVRLVVTRGRGPRGYTPPERVSPTVIVTCFPGDASALPARPLRVRWCTTRLPVSPDLAGLKTLSRLEQVLARSEWRDPEIDEGLMCDATGSVVCGTASNLFVVRAGRLLTPPVATSGVRGIMRGVVLAAAAESGLPVAEAGLRPDDLATATEVFMTNALAGIAPVVELSGRPLAVGPLTRRLRALLAERGVIECAAPL